LIENNSEFAISSEEYQIAMMRYDYGIDYKKDFLMQKYGGGGVFVETQRAFKILCQVNLNFQHTI
jgi:hypothetical protein